MMKTLFVASVVLSLISVCHPVSLACTKLLKPVDKGPDLSGTWYFIAVSMKSCLLTSLLNSIVWPSLKMDITSMGKPNLYSIKLKAKMYGFCANETDEVFYENNNMYDVDDNKGSTGNPGVLLQSSCPDCMVVKDDDKDDISTFLLFSRRQNITAAELQEFEKQAECLGWSKPQVLNTDHDYENCKSEDDIDVEGLSSMIYERLKNVYKMQLLSCLSETLLSYPYKAYEWAGETWNNLW